MLASRLLVLLAAGGVYFFFFLAAQFEARTNIAFHAPPYQASAKARELHEQLFVADLHADTLLWDRDLLDAHSERPRGRSAID